MQAPAKALWHHSTAIHLATNMGADSLLLLLLWLLMNDTMWMFLYMIRVNLVFVF